jgi:glycosyltransferase involved in cell wall biosynthesis
MPQNLNRISIITVSYNSEKTIENTIKSIIAQDCPLIEYIIVDGGSIDGTKNIIQKYIGEIDQYVSEPDKGIYDAMNKGINLASGDIIGILNSDDIFASNAIISDIVNVFSSNPEIDAVYGNITYFKNESPGKVVRTWITKPYYPKFFDNGEVPPHPSLFVRKNVYNSIGAYFPDFKITSDYEFMLRAFKVYNYKPYYLNKFIVNMRMGGESTKSFKNILIGNREITKAWKMNNLQPPVYFWFLRFAKKILQYLNR